MGRQHLRHLRPGKRQAWTPLTTEGSGLRHLRPGKRQAWTPLTTEGSGLSACSKLPRSVWGIWGLANGRLERPWQQRAVAWVPARSCRAAFEAFEAWQTAGLNALNNRGQWPECLVEAAAERFRHLGQWLECLLEAAAQRLRHLRPGKRQAWTPLTTEGSGLSACSKLPRSVWGIWGLANGRLERP